MLPASPEGRTHDAAAAVAHLQAFNKKFGARFIGLVERRLFTVFGAPNDELREMLKGLNVTYMRRLDGFSLAQSG